MGLFTTMSAGLIRFLYAAMIFYLRKSPRVEMKQWDINSVTTANFTVLIDFSECIWKHNGKYMKMNKTEITPENVRTMHFKNILKKNI